MTDKMTEYQDTIINKKDKVKSGMKNLQQQRMSKACNYGLDKYDWLLLPDENWNLKMIQVQIVDKETYDKDTENVVKKYISPFEMIGYKIDNTNVKKTEDIYYIIKDAHIELSYGEYLYQITRPFYKSYYNLFIELYKQPSPIIINGQNIWLNLDRYEWQIVNRCLYRHEQIPERILGIRYDDIADFPPIVTAMPQKKYCVNVKHGIRRSRQGFPVKEYYVCNEPFISTNNSQKYCERCGDAIQSENTNAYMEKKREQGWRWDWQLQKYVTWDRYPPKNHHYISKREYITMRRNSDSDRN